MTNNFTEEFKTKGKSVSVKIEEEIPEPVFAETDRQDFNEDMELDIDKQFT